jgi:hypothetical protein
MNNVEKLIKLIGLLVVVVGAGILIGWLGSRRPVSKAPVVSQPDGTSAVSAPSLANSAPPQILTPTNRSRPRTRTVTSTNTLAAALSSGNIITNWEDHIDEILGSEVEDPIKARQMLQLFPRFPEDGQVEVAQHLSNLTADEDYAGLAQYATNTSLPESVLEVLLDDALNRPNSVKLPLLLEIARNDQHAKATDARELLELFLEEDYGQDWARWQAKMQEWLQENPD